MNGWPERTLFFIAALFFLSPTAALLLCLWGVSPGEIGVRFWEVGVGMIGMGVLGVGVCLYSFWRFFLSPFLCYTAFQRTTIRQRTTTLNS